MSLLDTARTARVYDLAQPLESTTPGSPNHPPFRMGLIRRHGDVVRADGDSAANELFSMGGHTGTHIDALCHVSSAGRLHGGLDATEASRGGRFTKLGVETIPPFVCRGVLLDVPAALDLDVLPPGHAVTAENLDRASARARIDVRCGDAVLVRTGWPVGRWTDPEAMVGRESGVPGPDLSAAQWLSEREIAVTGSDTIAYEWLAPGKGHSSLPVHRHLLVEAGIYIIELLDLEDAASDGVTEFLFVAAPVKLVGATGAPIRPLMVVA